MERAQRANRRGGKATASVEPHAISHRHYPQKPEKAEATPKAAEEPAPDIKAWAEEQKQSMDEYIKAYGTFSQKREAIEKDYRNRMLTAATIAKSGACKSRWRKNWQR